VGKPIANTYTSILALLWVLLLLLLLLLLLIIMMMIIMILPLFHTMHSYHCTTMGAAASPDHLVWDGMTSNFLLSWFWVEGGKEGEKEKMWS